MTPRPANELGSKKNTQGEETQNEANTDQNENAFVYNLHMSTLFRVMSVAWGAGAVPRCAVVTNLALSTKKDSRGVP